MKTASNPVPKFKKTNARQRVFFAESVITVRLPASIRQKLQPIAATKSAKAEFARSALEEFFAKYRSPAAALEATKRRAA